MSLLATASVWESDTGNSAPKKRVATMGRKTIKNRRPDVNAYSATDTDADTESNGLGNIENMAPYDTIQETQAKNEENNTKVNTLLTKITGFSGNNAGNGLADFVPLENPVLSQKTLPQYNPFVPSFTQKTTQPIQKDNKAASGQYYHPVDAGTGYSRYAESYPASTPYYAKMGIGSQSAGNDKWTEKMNYMIHLLEQQQMEKTSNVAEEFILYAMLGVFMIYIVDGFARSGKYVR